MIHCAWRDDVPWCLGIGSDAYFLNHDMIQYVQWLVCNVDMSQSLSTAKQDGSWLGWETSQALLKHSNNHICGHTIRSKPLKDKRCKGRQPRQGEQFPNLTFGHLGSASEFSLLSIWRTSRCLYIYIYILTEVENMKILVHFQGMNPFYKKTTSQESSSRSMRE